MARLLSARRLASGVSALGLLASAASLAGCGGEIAAPMHVRKGEEPRYADDSVRFRTTYYFRVYDVCEDGLQRGTKDPDSPFIGKSTQGIQKDSIYRFRMTGKASSLFNTVQFESGTLKAYQIDPFGANVAYDEANRRFYFKSQESTEADARIGSAMSNTQQLLKLRDQLKGTGLEADVLSAVREELRAVYGSPRGDSGRLLPAVSPFAQAFTALETVRDMGKGAWEKAGPVAGTLPSEFNVPAASDAQTKSNDFRVAVTDPNKKLAEAIGAAITDFEARGINMQKQIAKAEELLRMQTGLLADARTSAAIDPSRKQAVTEAEGKVAAIQTFIAGSRRAELDFVAALNRLNTLRGIAVAGSTAGNSSPGSDDCGVAGQRRRGFQVLGPEGVRTFNQDERLIMAMTSDGKPLIGVLQELSSRVLTPKMNEAETRLPLAEERIRIFEARSALDRDKNDKPEEAGNRVEAVLKVLRGGQ